MNDMKKLINGHNKLTLKISELRRVLAKTPEKNIDIDECNTFVNDLNNYITNVKKLIGDK